MDGLSVLKMELTEARAKVSALERAIKGLGGKLGTVSLSTTSTTASDRCDIKPVPKEIVEHVFGSLQ
jgi:hypothetical protein